MLPQKVQFVKSVASYKPPKGWEVIKYRTAPGGCIAVFTQNTRARQQGASL